jgi:hypothetical protein
LAWDVTVADTFAESHIAGTSTAAGSAADQAAANKTAKYAVIATTHILTPIDIETGGTWNNLAIEFAQELGKRITAVTNEPLETQYLFQRISMAPQRGNVVSFQSTFNFDV